VQAQDFNSAQWAIGARLKGCTKQSVQEAFNQGEILRTHVLRPTWHFVTPENIRWMLQLSAKRIIQSMKSGDRPFDPIDDATQALIDAVVEKFRTFSGITK